MDEYLRTYARPGVMASAFARYRTIDSEVARNALHVKDPITTPTLAVGAEHVSGPAVGDNLRTAASDLQTADAA